MASWWELIFFPNSEFRKKPFLQGLTKESNLVGTETQKSGQLGVAKLSSLQGGWGGRVTVDTEVTGLVT